MDKVKLIAALESLKEDAEMAISGDWDVTALAAKEGFELQISMIDEMLAELRSEPAHKVRKVCSHCGSDDVKVDAWVKWDEAIQDWVVNYTFYVHYCESCEGDCNIKDVEI